ncbi:basic helix-loop-helix transcription factor scleraxis-like isoform X2 [Copidosoma floridanum]|nr:basic helix-loop-helix transcription factor scleraxis-like isoform X2 [Copidosoma floridanum]
MAAMRSKKLEPVVTSCRNQRCQSNNLRQWDRSHQRYRTSEPLEHRLSGGGEAGSGRIRTTSCRSRVRRVNTAFGALRTLLPTRPADRKLSKIETLKLAGSYINHLLAILVVGASDRPCSRLLPPPMQRDEDKLQEDAKDNDSCAFCTVDRLEQDVCNLTLDSLVLADFNESSDKSIPPAV